MGVRVELEEFISQRLRKHYGICKQSDEASQSRTKKSKSNLHKKTSIRSLIVVDTSYASEVDDDSEVTRLSRGGTMQRINNGEKKPSKAALGKQTLTQHVRNSTEEKGGSKPLPSKEKPRNQTRLSLLCLIHSMLSSLREHHRLQEP